MPRGGTVEVEKRRLIMEGIEFFVKLRDASDDVVKAMESKDAKETENALGRFMLLMVQLNAMK